MQMYSDRTRAPTAGTDSNQLEGHGLEGGGGGEGGDRQGRWREEERLRTCARSEVALVAQPVSASDRDTVRIPILRLDRLQAKSNLSRWSLSDRCIVSH